MSCTGKGGNPKQAFLGYMFYNRLWFKKDLYGLTIGGGQMNNPGRYLVLLPPINGATAITGTPYFTENPGQPYHAYDFTTTSITCPASSLLSGLRWDIAIRTCRIGRAAAASLLREEIMALPALRLRYRRHRPEPTCWRTLKPLVAEVSECLVPRSAHRPDRCDGCDPGEVLRLSSEIIPIVGT